ncbi:MAG TPA: hypothetical protein VG096_18790 [Bryobacteraceae bacterium]|jgi:hypothetical protein|nr:hypothetical protein [Bryobacteraceae bacterium]
MKLGANEPKKIVMLGLLAVVAGYLLYSNVLAGPSNRETPVAAPNRAADVPAIAGAGAAVVPAAATTPRASAGRGRSDEFHPVLRSKRPEDQIDPTKVDPTLRRDLLAKLQAVTASGPGRNLFQFGQAPVKPPTGPDITVKLKPPMPVPTVTEPPKPTGPPPPPPITLKYYGFTSARAGGGKTAFFLDGEDILVAKEGDTLKRRYRVVRIGLTSVVMEDTESKQQRTIPLTEEAG